MGGNTYKTEEIICGKTDCVMHFNLLEALDWVRTGIDVVLFRQDGDKWIGVNYEANFRCA